MHYNNVPAIKQIKNNGLATALSPNRWLFWRERDANERREHYDEEQETKELDEKIAAKNRRIKGLKIIIGVLFVGLIGVVAAFAAQQS